jgi:DedD protein
MTDIARTQDVLTHDPAALRRRARRRLVGAVALALTAVVVVPMLFDPDPKPLGSDVDIRIPAQESPFEPAAPTDIPPPAGEQGPVPQAAEPTGMPPPTGNAIPAEPTPTRPPPPKAVAPELPREAKKPVPKPGHEEKIAAPEALKADAAFASKGYYLQLGAFSNGANAKALQKKVEAAGFKVGMNDSNSQYRVRVGPIPDREKALETLAKLRAKGFSPVMIGP